MRTVSPWFAEVLVREDERRRCRADVCALCAKGKEVRRTEAGGWVHVVPNEEWPASGPGTLSWKSEACPAGPIHERERK